MVCMLYPAKLLRLVLPVPLDTAYDYAFPESERVSDYPEGIRVQVNFRGQVVVGWLRAVIDAAESAVPVEKIKPALAILDAEPLLPSSSLELIQFAHRYYQHPLGEVFQVANPTLVNKGQSPPSLKEKCWFLADEHYTPRPSAAKQIKALAAIKSQGQLFVSQLNDLDVTQATLKTLVSRGVLDMQAREKPKQAVVCHPAPYPLDTQQKACLDAFDALPEGYHPVLLEGVTGSGKTEVYLHLVERTLKQGRQALILVPEIGLTPQTLSRFAKRFGCDMAIFHSSLSESQKLVDWQKAKTGRADIIIGTRSAIFTPCLNLGLIIVDEEHDLSYKQQDSLRYSARDLACVRGNIHQVPVVLGSATPSLETLYNAEIKKFHHWVMGERAGSAKACEVSLFDIKQQPMVEGIAEPLLDDIRQTLSRDEQVLLFINRRGFAPVLMCHDCGWVEECPACDVRLTVHKAQGLSICHHCGGYERTPTRCPVCQSLSIEPQGVGTERLALAMAELFPDVPSYRIDRDTTRKKGSMEAMMTALHDQGRAILIGTQMLAKGHHLPNVTLVVIVDADAGLMGADFRAVERFGQLITQVTGRSGRGEKTGRAIIQTHYPDHEQLLKLIHFGYRRFAMDILAERKRLNLPPFAYMALVRLEAREQQEALSILHQLIEKAPRGLGRLLGPFASGLARRAHFFRFQVHVYADSRGALQALVKALLTESRSLIKHRHRFSIDIDPQDMA